MQTAYIIERFGHKKQIARFNEEGNRIVVIKVESFDSEEEMEFILNCLNEGLNKYPEPYQSKGSFNILFV